MSRHNNLESFLFKCTKVAQRTESKVTIDIYIEKEASMDRQFLCESKN